MDKTTPRAIEKWAGQVEGAFLLPWEGEGETAEEFLPDFVEDVQHIARCLRGTEQWRGLRQGTALGRIRQGFQLLAHLLVRKEVLQIRALAGQTRLVIADRGIRSVENGERPIRILDEG